MFLFYYVSNKTKGSTLERYLVSRLRDKGFAVIRAPASGSNRKDHVPDVIAMKSGVIILIEMKSRKNGNKIYIQKEQAEGIKEFAKKSGGELFLGAKIAKDLKFLRFDELRRTEAGNYVADLETIKSGMDFDELVRYVEGKISKTLDSFM
ncbi:endonuclease [Sulfolobus acidocaldarius]|uniref:Crossover junction endodeoxyribonuclease Hjc n=3 Tax=Sulfolobus acidocaldarius TaxID=2285 RepID=A0A0U3GPS1_9CREN|nr:holliday junction resolvase [Sulfolobus acidocaldarius N8]AGE73744.1 holliday junction resolvase [Sulfolobus acidocaldarius Ron12/I]ALU30296.1 endonuclease [Sulfolobus acidocaldarius]ALU31013.1 endonuclease [Sulfolobus acidocaldarius]WCM35381.1 endonuclease [Sulfolobus acidocaldarius DSM 639]